MNNRTETPKFNLVRLIKKFSLSAFVVLTFIAYALQKPAGANENVGLTDPQNNHTVPPAETPQTPALAPTDTAGAPAQAASPTNPPAPATTATTQPFFFPTPTQVVPPTAVVPVPSTGQRAGQYKDGTYTGPEVDAVYGYVQVQAVIQNGQIANVQFLEYPNDRRTSVRINSFAVPRLQQEAVQAQSANVNLITGATLTCEAFQQSLQNALNKAKGSA